MSTKLSNLVRVNLGSGQRKFGTYDYPWLNVDVNPKWEPDLVADGAHLDTIADESCCYVVLHHVLEHFGCGEADAMLKECYRILAPGGSLIVCVPDLRALAKAWLKGDINDWIYVINLYGAYMDSEADRHRWGYSEKGLKETLMASAAWSRVDSFDFRQIAGADIAKAWWILGAESIK